MRIDILHTNDIHSHVENFVKSADIIKKQREMNDNTLLVDAGDILTGEYQYSILKGSVERDIVNHLQYDIMALGNHDFDSGFAYLKDHMNQVKTKYILSNVIDPLSLIGNYTPYYIHQIEGIKIGFVSFLLPYVETSIAARGMTGLKFIEVKQYREIISKVREQADIVIALNHHGYERDVELAKANIGIDLIIGAHSHTLLKQAEIVNGVPIVQTGSFNDYLGKISFEIIDGKLLNFKSNVINLNEHDGVDEKVSAIIQKHLAKVNKMASEVFAHSANDLEGRREVMISRSTNLGTLICDSYLYRAQSLGVKVDFALVNARGLRQGIKRGPINYRHLYNVMPFDKKLVICELTGADIISALNNRFEFQTAKLGIINTSVGRIFFDKEPNNQLISNKVYRLITVDYVYEHEAFTSLQNGKVIVEDAGRDIEVVAEYLKTLPNNFEYASNNLVSTKEK